MNTVEDVLTEKKLYYRDSGKDYLIHCLNPKHDDSNPSMRVDKVTGMYHCFSCGYKGNILKDSGANYSPTSIKVLELKRKIQDIIKPSHTIPATSTPYAFDLREIPAAVLQEFGAFSDSTLYPERIMFPIKDFVGNITCFVGRYTHSNAKSKYKVFPEESEMYCFPTNPKIFRNTIVLVEGIFDMLNLYVKGIKCAVAAMGTHTILKQWQRVLMPYKAQGVNRIILCMDGDDAGRSSAEKLAKLLEKEFLIEIIELPEGKDPGSLSKNEVNEHIVDRLM